MITKANYFDKVNSISYNALPEALKEGYDTIKFGSKDYTTWEYLEDDPEFLDLFFSKLNQFLKSETDSPKAKKEVNKVNYKGLQVEIRPKSARSKLFVVWDVKSNQIFSNDSFKSIKEAEKFVEQNEMELVEIKEKSKKEKNKASKPKVEKKEPKQVEQLPLEISFIRRYVQLHGKVVGRPKVLNLLNSLQKAMLEKRIRKASAYASEIMNIQDQLILLLKKMGEQVEIVIANKNLEKYQEISSSERIRDSIALLKRYLAIHGKEGVEDKAKKLKLAMEKMVRNGKVTKDDPYATKLELAYKSLVEYLKDKNATPAITSESLNGIKSLIQINPAQAAHNIHKSTLSSHEILKMKFETIGLKGKYRQLIGDPSVGFTAMVFGQPKSGKSTLMLDFANELAKNHGKVLYAAIEEGYGYTLKEKIQRVGAAHSRLEFSEKLPNNLDRYDFVFVDSVSRAGMELEDMIKLKNKYPKTGFVFIFHSTKDGKFRGGNDLAHEVDVIIEVEPGLAKASGRFNAGGSLKF